MKKGRRSGPESKFCARVSITYLCPINRDPQRLPVAVQRIRRKRVGHQDPGIRARDRRRVALDHPPRLERIRPCRHVAVLIGRQASGDIVIRSRRVRVPHPELIAAVEPDLTRHLGRRLYRSRVPVIRVVDRVIELVDPPLDRPKLLAERRGKHDLIRHPGTGGIVQKDLRVHDLRHG